MKVLVLVPGRWHAFDLASCLHEAGCLHRIVTTYPKSKTRKWGVPDERVISLPVQLILTRLVWRLGGERLAMRLQFHINNIFAKNAAKYVDGADIVHAWSGSAEPALVVARRIGIPTVLERSSAHMQEQCRILRKEYQKLGRSWTETPIATVERELREYAIANVVAVPSLFVERSFLTHGFPSNKLNRNGFGVNLANFSPGPKADAIFRVIFAGSLSVRKGVGYLVDAFRLANLPQAELILVGSSLAETAQLVGAPDKRIILTGHRPQAELVRHYRGASVFVMASVEEGQAMVQFQALACGLPLVCTTNTGGEDLLALGGNGVALEDGVTREFPAGYVVPAGDHFAIARCLVLLHSDPALLARKKQAALNLRAMDISWSRYARGNLEMYERLLKVNEVNS